MMSNKMETEDSDDVEFIGLEYENEEQKNRNLKSPKHLKLKHIDKSPGFSKKILKSSSVSRRKTVHKVINTNDEILFESYPKISDSSGRVSKNDLSIERRERKYNVMKYNEDEAKFSKESKDEEKDFYSIVEHMHRIAFLKACINYMLLSVGKETINFDETGITLSKLVNKYNAISPTTDADEINCLSD